MTNSLEPSPPPPSFGGSEQSRPSWRWRFEDVAGATVSPPEGGVAATVPSFPSQSDAESWIGEVWRELLDEGVDQVSLFEADRQVYGPMSLHAAG